jgi:hypothetical protein
MDFTRKAKWVKIVTRLPTRRCQTMLMLYLGKYQAKLGFEPFLGDLSFGDIEHTFLQAPSLIKHFTISGPELLLKSMEE